MSFLLFFTSSHSSLIFTRCILAGLAFRSSGPYVNMAHLPPNTVERFGNQVNLTKTVQPAIGVMLGITQRARVIDPFEHTTKAGTSYQLKQLTILPFQHELPLLASGWAEALGMDELMISFTNHTCQGLNLATRRSWPKAGSSEFLFSSLFHFYTYVVF